jgi:hypothetical protein
MLIAIVNNQIIAPEQVCQSCLLADQNGQPRWRHGKLRCGQIIHRLNYCSETQVDTYECQMGLRLMEIES